MQNSWSTWLTSSLKFKCTCLQYGAHSLGELSSTNCQKGPSTIWLRYPVPGTVLAGTGAGTGFEKMAGYPANRNRISGTSLMLILPIISRSTVMSAHLTFKGYSHEGATEHEHKHKISCPSTERALLQHSTVAVREDHVKQKVKANGTKEHEIRHQSPYLKHVQSNKRTVQLNERFWQQ